MDNSRLFRRGDGTGRRAGLKIRCRKAWGFESPPRHHHKNKKAGFPAFFFLEFFILGIGIMIWKPNVTVAAVIERDGKFLLVEEETSQGVRFNQPAGHLEADESLLTGVAREVLEESAYSFTPQHLLGIYRWHAPESDTTYLRFAFTGAITGHDAARTLDTGIIQAVWLTPDEIRPMQERHRSPLVLRCIEDYLAGKRYPLELITHYE